MQDSLCIRFMNFLIAFLMEGSNNRDKNHTHTLIKIKERCKSVNTLSDLCFSVFNTLSVMKSKGHMTRIIFTKLLYLYTHS